MLDATSRPRLSCHRIAVRFQLPPRCSGGLSHAEDVGRKRRLMPASHLRLLTVSSTRALPCWPCSPLWRSRDRVRAASLSPDSRATSSPSEARRRSSQTLRCPGQPRPASDLASCQEGFGARQRFSPCIAFDSPGCRDAYDLRYRRQAEERSGQSCCCPL
jgi:hypothetical protein